MTYDAILQKAVLDVNFRTALLENPIQALKDYSINATQDVIDMISKISKDKFLSFIENIIEAESIVASGYM